MKFLWPHMLWLLALAPLLAGGYLLALRRRQAASARYRGLRLDGEARERSAWLRHLPALFLFAGLTALLVASARPAALIELPAQHQSIVLSIDVSGSMRANDVQPSRLAAAQAAAREFIAGQPSSVRIGIVEFAGTAALVQAPTASRDKLLAAIAGLQPKDGTAIGSGILASLLAVLPEAGRGAPLRRAGEGVAAIVLLTDGQSLVGPAPRDAAALAAAHGVRVYTVGVGTESGALVHGEGWSIAVGFDEGVLRDVAGATGGEYFRAGTAGQLNEVYRTLRSKLVLERRATEMTALFSAAAALALALGAMLSLAWWGRIL